MQKTNENMVQEKTLLEQIQLEYGKLKNKSKFILEFAQVVGRKPNTIRTHWIGQLWAIPEEFQQTMLDEIKKRTLTSV